MAGKKRAEDTSVADRLYEEFYRFSFYNAVTLLERFASEREPLGKALTPEREAVRFTVTPGFCFPPSDLRGLKPAQEEGGRPILDVAFLGLVGPSGVLPHWYNELAVARAGEKDGTLAAFFDLFHHRLLSLFFLAWKKHRFEICHRGDAADRFSLYLRSLIGLGTGGLSGGVGLPADSPIYLGGVFSRCVPSAGAVRAAVSYYFGVEAAIDQFVERLLPLGPEERTALGLANCEVGVDAVCGSEVREAQTKFRLNLGPMPFSSYVRFLPGGDLLSSVFALVRYQVGVEYEFEVRVILQREEVPASRLGNGAEHSGRLGWSAWLKSPDFHLSTDPHATFQEPPSPSRGGPG